MRKRPYKLHHQTHNDAAVQPPHESLRMNPQSPPSGAPRWPTLLALLVSVLAAHVVLIVGELPPGWMASDAVSTLETGASSTPASAPAATGSSDPKKPANTVAVQVSQVRWIAPPTPPAPAPASMAAATPPAPQPRAPKPVVTPPATPSEAPSPVTEAPVETPYEAAPAAPVPETTVAQAPEPAATAASASASATPTEPVAAPPPTEGPPGSGVHASDNALPGPPAAVQAASSADLSYDIQGQAKGLNYTADARLQWQNDGSRYSARLEISAFLVGSRVSTSVGSMGPQGLAPERYGEQRRRSERATHFDAANGRIRFSNNAPDAAWAPGAQDRLSFFLQLSALLQAAPAAYPPDSRISLLVAGTGSAEVWSFQVGAPETLKLPAGEVRAVRLLRPPRHTHDNTVEIWLAPDLEHLPVRIRLTEQNGDVADQRLRTLPPVIQ